MRPIPTHVEFWLMLATLIGSVFVLGWFVGTATGATLPKPPHTYDLSGDNVGPEAFLLACPQYDGAVRLVNYDRCMR